MKNPFYRRWAAADFLSVIGTWMQSVAASWLVLDVTGSATRTGLVIALQALPSLLLGPISGRLADNGRVNPRMLLVVTQLLLAGSTACGAFGSWMYASHDLDGGTLANLLSILALTNGALHAIEGPNLGRFSLTLIGQEQIPAALSLGALLSSAGRIIGTAGAGLVVFFGVPAIFLFNASTFVVVGLTLASIPAGSPLSNTTEKSSGKLPKQLWILLITSVVLGGLGRNYQVTLGALTKEEGFGVAGFAQASTLFAAGAALGGLGAVIFAQKRLRHFYLLALILAALQICLGRTSTFNEVLFAVVPIAISAVLLDVTFASILQGRSASQIRGKVIALQGAGGAVGSLLGAPILGWLSQTCGASQALVIAGSVCLTVTLISLGVMSRVAKHRVVVKPWRTRTLIETKTRSITSWPTMKSSEELSSV